STRCSGHNDHGIRRCRNKAKGTGKWCRGASDQANRFCGASRRDRYADRACRLMSAPGSSVFASHMSVFDPKPTGDCSAKCPRAIQANLLLLRSVACRSTFCKGLADLLNGPVLACFDHAHPLTFHFINESVRAKLVVYF